MRVPQRGDARREGVVAPLPPGERAEIAEQCDGRVVLRRFPAGDARVDGRPGGVLVGGQVVVSSVQTSTR